jgi:DNA-binding GntR family transcriptional regulator
MIYDLQMSVQRELLATRKPGRAKLVRSQTSDDFENLSAEIKQTLSIPDKVADLLREMILSGRWRPGDRIVETQVARQLDIGQPAVREALGKLEEAGIVRRFPNSGCVVTQLSKEEFGQIFRLRTELEGLAVELAIENHDPQMSVKLNSALSKLQKAGRKANAEEYYRADFEFHRTIWKLADNRFLEKALTQLVVPLFNFAIIEVIANHNLDLDSDAQEHKQIVEALLRGDKDHARRIVRRAMSDFWERGIALVHVDHSKPSANAKVSAKSKPRSDKRSSITR